MTGYIAFPPPASIPSTIEQTEFSGACATRSDQQGSAEAPTGDDRNAEQKAVDEERQKRRERERALGEESEIEWVRAGGVLRDAFGRRDKARTEQIRRELHVQEVERERTARWEAYEARWRAMQSSTAQVDFNGFPWPLCERASGRELGVLTRGAVTSFLFESLAVRGNKTTKRERIRSSLLRWHPDKTSLVLSRIVPEDVELVQEGIHVVFGILVALQDAERAVT